MDKNGFLDPLFDFIAQRQSLFRVHGLKGSSGAYVISRAARRSGCPILVLSMNEERAERFLQEIPFFLGQDYAVHLYPGWDLKPFEKISPASEVMGQRWKVRNHLLTDPVPAVIISSLSAALTRVPPRKILRHYAFSLARQQEFLREELITRLEGMGYSRVSLVSEMGEFAVRGHLVDVFSPSAPLPLRLEFTGDNVESIRTFDPDTQRSSDDREQAQILPVKEVLSFQEFRDHAVEKLTGSLTQSSVLRSSAEEILEKIRQGIPFPGVESYQSLFYPALETFFDYLPPQTVIFLEDPLELEEELARFWEENREYWQHASARGEYWPQPEELFLPAEEFADLSRSFPRVAFQGLKVGKEEEAAGVLSLETEGNERLRSDLLASKSEEGILELLAHRIRGRAEKGIARRLFCFWPAPFV